ncbi:MAG: hypothetical protein GX272_05570 [Epulopiscium sp.]|nr:hypothetical protein [Candidatus Epulonipiscium sp.]
MDRVRKFLRDENESGFSYIEVLIGMAIFAISVAPILSMIFNASKNSISGRRTYEATIMAQNLSEQIKNEIEERLVNGDSLGEGTDPQSLAKFLDSTDGDYSKFNETFNGEEYNYDIYIKKTDGSDEYSLIENYDYIFVHINGGENPPAKPSSDPVAITELKISSNPDLFNPRTETPMTSKESFSHDGINWSISMKYPNEKIQVDLVDKSTDSPSNKIVVDYETSPPAELGSEDRVEFYLDASEIDVSKIDPDTFKFNITLENNTKADVLFTIYRSNKEDVEVLDKIIEVFPIQNDSKGNIFIERKTEMIPRENYIIRIVVRDRKNNSKILKDMVDIYSHDYRTAAY